MASAVSANTVSANTIRDQRGLNNHIDYIHYNPVKHGHAFRPADCPHSTIHRYIEQGLLTQDWGAKLTFDDNIFGE